MTALELPPEIFDLIFSCLDTLALFRSSWVAQAWRSSAFPLLLERFSSLVLDSGLGGAKNKHPPSLLGLFSIVWPSHGGCVRSIKVVLHRQWSHPTHEEICCSQLLCLLPNLQSLDLSNPVSVFWDEEDWVDVRRICNESVQSEVFKHLTSLTLGNIKNIPIWSLLSSCPILEQITLDNCSLEPQWEEVPQATSRLLGIHPLRRITLESIWGDNVSQKWNSLSEFVLKFSQLPGCHLCHIALGRLSNFPFPGMIGWFGNFRESLVCLDLGTTVFDHSLNVLRQPSIQDLGDQFTDNLAGFRLSDFSHLESFRISIRVSSETSELYFEDASLCIYWLARQIEDHRSRAAFKEVMVQVRDDYAVQPDLYWDGPHVEQSWLLLAAWLALDCAFSQPEESLRLLFELHATNLAKARVTFLKVVESLNAALPEARRKGLMQIRDSG
ncbi:hypothetical protein DL96DRAFT_1710446 [Flagelloscypha sp. PMI_526]|nr:hypothetical protein DL96DRAFT_1710446 [Flagelloscypha sp. PMI_526]